MKLLSLSVLFFCAVAAVAEEPSTGVGEPPTRRPAELREERANRALRSSTVSRERLTVTTPGFYDLSVAGDLEVGGAIFRNGYPFIHQDGGVYNTAVGTDALINLTSGYYNVAFGYRALRDNQSGFGNTGVGGVALLSNTTGFGNTGIGDMTLRSNTDGDYNTAIGQYALLTNTTASNNVAIGHSAMMYGTTSTANTAIGVDALRYNTTGAGLQTAVGYQAARNNYGYSNTAVGGRALYTATSSYQNVAVGTRALYLVATGSNNIGIGHEAGINIGPLSADNIFVGSPGVAMNEMATIRIGDGQGKTFVAGIRGIMTGNADATAVLIDSAGQLGTVNSSRRVKEDIRDMGAASDAVLGLRPVTFRYRQAFDDGGKPVQYGLIAEEVAEVFPELVVYDEAGEPQTVKYHLLSILLLNELREERAANQDRDQRLAELERRLSALDPSTSR